MFKVRSMLLVFALVAAVAAAQTYTTWTATPPADPVTSGAGLARTSLHTVTTTSSLIPALGQRTDIMMAHVSGETVYVNIGGATASTTANYIKLPSGSSIAVRVPGNVPISVVTAANSAVISVVQTVAK